jgi:hypothetical protein
MTRLASAAIALVATLPSLAAADAKTALADVRDALDLVEETGGRCKRDVYAALQDAEDDLVDGEIEAASRGLRALRRVDSCPKAVERLVRSARDELRDLEDDRPRDRVKKKDIAKVPARPTGVPFSDFHKDCLDHWYITEIARNNTDNASYEQFRTLSSAACSNAGGMSAAQYPNGNTLRTSTGTWYYPNGNTAKTSTGTFYYPNGNTAKTSTGTWYYPNGNTAKTSTGTWYYANGNTAGGYEALAAYACSKVGDQACNAYRHALKSDLDDWRIFALVQMAGRVR